MLDVSDKRNVPKERPWYKPALRLLKKVQKRGKILDLGCGLGEFSEKLKKLGFKVTGADGSENYVQKMKEKGFSALSWDFNNTFPIANEEYDVVSTLEVIEHVEKAEQFLSETSRILKKRGYLLISTPNYAFIGVRLKILLGYPIPDEGYHFRFFTHKTFYKLLQKYNFKVIADNSISFLPFYHLIKNKPKARRVFFLKNLFASKIIVLAQKR